MCDSGESPYVSVCHTVSSMTSPSICQMHELSVRFHLELCLSVCPLSIPSIQPSAKFTVKVSMSIAVQNFPKIHFLGNSVPSIHHWICLSIQQAVHQSLHHHLLKTDQNSLVIMGRKMQ